MTNRRKIDVNPFNSITTIIMLVLFFAALIFLIKGIFQIMAFVAPALLIGALIVDYKVVVSYGKMLFNLLKSNILMGIGAVFLTVVAFPVVAAFLLGKALFKKKVNQIRQDMETKTQGEYAEFEEMESEIKRVELPPVPKRQKEKQKLKETRNDYENLFDDI